MLFKDRADAGVKLAKLFVKQKDVLVVSLLRGGVVVGDIVAKKLGASHLPLVVTKVSAPGNPELAIGALCFDVVSLERSVIDALDLSKSDVRIQIAITREKFLSYCKRFHINEKIYDLVRGKTIILTDDGLATGATARAALLYLKSKHPKKVLLTVPVAPEDFDARGFDQFITLVKEKAFGSVSQFYKNFPQVEDEDVEKIISPSS